MENKVEVQGQDSAEESRGSGWDSMGDWSETHPFELNQNSEPSDEENEDDHEDDDFEEVIKKSREYLEYGRQQFERLKEKYTDVFNPSDKSVRSTIEPFFESIRSDIDTLLDIGAKLEKNKYSEHDVGELVAFFAEKFGVSNVPDIILVSIRKNNADEIGGAAIDEGRSRASQNLADNSVIVSTEGVKSSIDIIRMIAHEIWHKRQYESGEEKYRINLAHYRYPHINYDDYRNQVLEKEAFLMGDKVDGLCRRTYLKNHPEEIFRLNKEYEKWVIERDPKRPWVGVDFRNLTIAHKEYERLNEESENGRERRVSSIFKRIFRREKK